MKTAIYGGSFNPPHLGHLNAARAVCETIKPDRLLVIPDNIPPHKDMDEGSPSPEERMELCRLCFASLDGAEVSDMEIKRQGRSYTAHTVERLKELYPEDKLFLTVGSDMFLSFEQWYKFEYILKNCSLAVVSREADDMDALRRHAAALAEKYSARSIILPAAPLPMSSRDIRARLRRRGGAEELCGEVYSRIIKHRFYGAQPELDWLRRKSEIYLTPKRVAHVLGCEAEAARLAARWGEDPETAAEAGILHDITKKLNYDEQLILCRKYDIILDKDQLANVKLLHAVTGAAFARDLFGVPDEIYDAIRWHTTGKPDMTLLEKIIYMADYIEPTRDFPGVDKLRALAYEDLDRAMALGLEMSLEDVKSAGVTPHEDTVRAYRWYSQRNKEEQK